MATTWYHTVNGEIIGETTSASRTSYLTDAIGSATATQGASGTTTATWRYKPFGAQLAKTGAGFDPVFLWCGAHGYKTTVDANINYVRARHLSTQTATWTTVDPLWPNQASFSYVHASPVTIIDPMGMQGVLGTTCINQLYKAQLHCELRNMATGVIKVRDVKFCDGDMGCDRCSGCHPYCTAEASATAKLYGTVKNWKAGVMGTPSATSDCPGVQSALSWLTAGWDKLFGTDVINLLLQFIHNDASGYWGIQGWDPDRTDVNCKLDLQAHIRVQWAKTCKPSGCDIPTCNKDSCPMPLIGRILVHNPLFMLGPFVKLCQAGVCAKRPKTCCKQYPGGLGGRSGGGVGAGGGGGSGGDW